MQNKINKILKELENPQLRLIELGLERVEKLLAELDNPHLHLSPVIHIAGTNGKGSTLAFLRAILEDAGYSIHQYISPHLVRFNERIIINGKEISDDYLLESLDMIAEKCKHHPATFFESTTAMAFHAFAHHKADYLLLETGLGGRLDATNVVMPKIVMISDISFDHQDFLGDRIEQIAAEKAGIIKENIPVFIAKQTYDEALQVLINKAKEMNAEIFLADDLPDGYQLGLVGEHQKYNAANAMQAAKYLLGEVNPKALAKAYWPARLQQLSSNIWLDGGHNQQGARVIRSWLQGRESEFCLIVAMKKKANQKEFLQELVGFQGRIILTNIPNEELGEEAGVLAKIASEIDLQYEIAQSPQEAIAMAGDDKKILFCGSLYFAGYILNHTIIDNF